MARSFVAGSSQYLESASRIGQVEGVSKVTVAAWMRRSTTSNYLTLGSIGESDAHALKVAFWFDGNIYFNVRNGSASFGSASSNNTNMLHVAQVFDGTQTGNSARLKGYINGSAQSLTFTGTIPSTTSSSAFLTSWRIGRDENGVTSTVYSGGTVAEHGIWLGALSAADIASLANGYAPLSVRPDLLIAYWPLFGRAGAGGDEEDWVGGLKLTAYNSPALADHPRIIYPRRSRIVSVASAAAATYTLTQATYVPASLTSTSVTPRIVRTKA